MSHAVASLSGFSNVSYSSALGISEAAGVMQNTRKKIVSEQLSTGFAQVSLIETLKQMTEVKNYCGELNWGGNGEAVVADTAFETAKEFLTTLPYKFQCPDVIPEPDGTMAFEWRFGSFRTMVVSFGERGRLEYAGLNGRSNPFFGRITFHGQIPIEIYRYLNSIAG